MAARVGDFNADLVGQAQRHFAYLFEPAVAHANLPWTRVAGDAYPLIFDFNDGCAERAGNAEGAIT